MEKQNGPIIYTSDLKWENCPPSLWSWKSLDDLLDLSTTCTPTGPGPECRSSCLGIRYCGRCPSNHCSDHLDKEDLPHGGTEAWTQRSGVSESTLLSPDFVSLEQWTLHLQQRARRNSWKFWAVIWLGKVSIKRHLVIFSFFFMFQCLGPQLLT